MSFLSVPYPRNRCGLPRYLAVCGTGTAGLKTPGSKRLAAYVLDIKNEDAVTRERKLCGHFYDRIFSASTACLGKFKWGLAIWLICAMAL
jgi:hypothetical protein